ASLLAEHPERSRQIALRARLTTSPREEDVLSADGKGSGAKVRPVRMPVLDRFEPTLTRSMPEAYALSREASEAALPILALHGIAVERSSGPLVGSVASFRIDAIERSPRLF